MTRQVRIGELVVDSFPVFDLNGYDKKSGETAFTTILRKDGVDSVLPVTIAEIGTSGDYKVEFTPDTEGVWKLQVFSGYSKDWWGGEYAAESGDQTELYEMVRRLLGLAQENIFIDNTVYDADGQLVASRVRIFDTKANCDAATDGGSETTGLIATYQQTGTWETVNQFEYYRQTKEP